MLNFQRLPLEIGLK